MTADPGFQVALVSDITNYIGGMCDGWSGVTKKSVFVYIGFESAKGKFADVVDS